MARHLSHALCAVLGITQAVFAQDDLDKWLKSQVPYSRQGVLDNIGPDGAKVSGASSGIVIASPSKSDPDYFYTWTRDSGLVAKGLVDMFLAGDDALEKTIRNYITAQAIIQTLDNPSGELSSGGLGEPKFHADETQFSESWGRPQNDGPALRVTAMVGYARHLIENDQQDVVKSVIWPLVQNDLSYITKHWNETTFDLWEEVEGSSFFTTASQFRALTEGSSLAQQLENGCDNCDSQDTNVHCFMQTYWSDSYMVSNVGNNDRTGKDANSIITSNHLFDPKANCSDITFQPCSPKALANHKAVTDSFRDEYGINGEIAKGKAVAVGRYNEDDYMGGNPWYLTTMAAAEQLYAALYQWDAQSSLSITDVSLSFFTDIYPDAAVDDYAADSQKYKDITAAVKTYADGYMSVAQQYTPDTGTMSEQYGRDDGEPLSASDLTWSYSQLLSAADRRNGTVPPSWGAATVKEPPTPCSSGSATGTYITPTVTQWPT